MSDVRRVAVTGVGLVSPVGIGVKESWGALKEGRSGIGTITHFDATEFATQIAGEVVGFNAEDWIPVKEVKKMDRFIHFALAAASMAMDDSGIEITESNAERVGVAVGSGMGGLTAIERMSKVLNERGPRRISPFFIPMSIINMASGHISMTYGAKGPNVATVTACASGNHAIGDAYRMIQSGRADAMICGGTESVITPLGIGGFNAMRALSTRNDEPERASRPFDIDRDGFVMGEGSGIVILEDMESAKKRGANILAEIAGYGMTGDAYHMSSPAPEGEGGARCMKLALEDTGVPLEDIGYINAHGTATKFGDELETLAMKTVFGEKAKDLAVSSTKSMTGHLLGAAGGLESVVTILAIHEGVVPPTINLENPDPECDLDYVPNEARQVELKAAMTNSFGFGGTNACLLFKRFEG